MIDIKLLRSNPDFVKAAVKKREMNLDDVIDEILALDQKRREVTGKVESMKAEQNADSKKIPQIKKAGGDIGELMARMKALSEQIKTADEELAGIEEEQKAKLLCLPNLPDSSFSI